MKNLNDNLLVEELISHCNFCLLKLANNELVAHSECEKEISNYKPKQDLKAIFELLFHSECLDYRCGLYYQDLDDFSIDKPKIRNLTDSDFLCPFGTIKSNKKLDTFFNDLFNLEMDDLRYGVECFREFEGYFLRPEIMIYDDKHYSDIFPRYNHYKLKTD